MANPGMTQNVETPQNEQVEKSGLAPAARKMLEGVFQQPQFQDVMNDILNQANHVLSGKGTQEEKDAVLNRIDFELQNAVNYSDAEGYARNYFERLKAQIEASEVSKV